MRNKYILIMIFMALILAVPIASATPEENTTIIYHMEEGSGKYINDSSIVGSNGTIYNTIANPKNGVWNSTFKYAGSYSFDFNDTFLTIANETMDNIPVGMVSFAIYVKSDPVGSFYIMDTRNKISESLGMFLITLDNTREIVLNTFGTHRLISSPLSLYTWYFINITWNSSGGYLYKDNIIDATNTSNIMGVLESTGYHSEARIGSYFQAPDSFVDALIDEFRIFNGSQISGPSPTTLSVTIADPKNQTYIGTSVPRNFTVIGTDYPAFPCWQILDGVNTSLGNITNNTANIATITANGGAHAITIKCQNATGTAESSKYFYTYLGLNASVFNSTGYAISSWALRAYNASGNYTYNSTMFNPAVLEWIRLPVGAVTSFEFYSDIPTAYFFNVTLNYSVNNTAWINLTNVTLSPKGNNIITLSASPGWSITENSIMNVSCSAAEGTPSLSVGGTGVSNPYSFTSSAASFSFNCSVGETTNYRPTYATNTATFYPGGTGCSNSTTFSFTKTITDLNKTSVNLNFTYFVNQNYTKPDLSDVASTAGVTLYTNISGGSYVIKAVVPSTPYNLTLYWGNYFNNISKTNSTLATDYNSVITGYTTANPYYIFSVMDEKSLSYQLPPASNFTILTMFCSNGSSSVIVNSTKILVSTFTTSDSSAWSVYYPSGQYNRYLNLGADIMSKNIYLADATSYTVLQIPIEMLDYAYWGWGVQIYKFAGAGEIVITEGLFDVTHKFNAYLIKDEKYFIRLYSGSSIKDMGFLYALEAATLQLSVSAMTIKPTISLIADNLLVGANFTSTTTLRVDYLDKTNETLTSRIRVYEGTNQTALFDNTYTNQSNFSVSINGLNSSKRYGVYVTVTHPYFGNSPVDITLGAGFLGLVADLGLGASGQWIISGITFVFIFFVSMISVPKIRFAMILVLLGVSGTMLFVFQNALGIGTLTLAIVFLVLGLIYEVRKGGMT